MSKTSIEWTERTWNPVRGCTRISPGCVNCYAERQSARGLPGHKSPTTGEPFAIMTSSGPRWTGNVELIPHMLDIPLKRRKPTIWFVNSMSDLFHEELPDEAIDRVFAVMALCPQHTFQVLTKRADRMLHVMTKVIRTQKFWPMPNVWLGVSVEDQQRADERIPLLLQAPAAVRFLSCEPLLGPVNLNYYFDLPNRDEYPDHFGTIDWVIVGGESGPGARSMHPEWARSIRGQCVSAGVPYFFKQWGGVNKKSTGSLLDGREWKQMPEVHQHA